MYGNVDESNLIKVVCDQCRNMTVLKEMVEYYDQNDLIAGFDNEPQPRLKLFCGYICRDKYKGGK